MSTTLDEYLAFNEQSAYIYFSQSSYTVGLICIYRMAWQTM